ncbi:MAG: GTPase Era [Synergistaceae bacterium]|nr:GTPase Era [Synergistaceae bacterium]
MNDNINQNGLVNFRAGFVAILGRPNVGKSSYINVLLGEHILAVSEKPQTTRNSLRCIYTDATKQIVFVDTPGIHVPKHALGEFMIKEAEDALSCVDAVCYVVEATDRSISEKDHMIIAALKEMHCPVILLVNKVDKLTKIADWQKVVDVYNKELNIKDSLCVSAKNEIGIRESAEAIAKFLPIQPAIYPSDMLMDSTERFLVAEIIRESIFTHTREEVPHNVAVVIDEFKSPDEYDVNIATIRATIIVARPGQKAILIGHAGSMLKEIGTDAREKLEKQLGYKIFLSLWVKVKPDWQKKVEELRHLGYVL